MAKKKFDLGLNDQNYAQPPKKKKELFNNPLEQTRSGRKKAAKVTGQKTDAMGRVRKTIFLDPLTINEIEELAASQGYGKMDFYEWLVLTGLQQFDRGLRPEVEGQPVVKSRIKIDR